MLEFDGLRKHEKTQHALEGLGSAAVAAVAATQVGRSKISKRDNKHKVYNY